ncbi:MAG: hypothetical protein EAX89_10935 [Candidatus Lokiarchaeota archaeon]|nr:hypothetical protein [Candidatus Lokiarchaeota archaeon]
MDQNIILLVILSIILICAISIFIKIISNLLKGDSIEDIVLFLIMGVIIIITLALILGLAEFAF